MPHELKQNTVDKKKIAHLLYINDYKLFAETAVNMAIIFYNGLILLTNFCNKMSRF
jgi:hypothetical protein